VRALPYFDEIIRRFAEDPDGEIATAFARHVHWGYYDAGDTGPDDTLAGYLQAAEAMTREVCALAGVGAGQRVLDVGCGFGGTIAHLDDAVDGVALVGLNIDGRQLEQAARTVRPRPGNSVAFVQGDATALPFPDDSFDTVLAIECAFHFPSRKRFLAEVRRVLRPGGRAVVSDFLRGDASVHEVATTIGPAVDDPFYGANAAPVTAGRYHRMATAAGFELTVDRDITEATLPTYPSLRRLYARAGLISGVQATDQLERVARAGLVQYHLLAFTGQRVAAPAAGAVAATGRG
jgi:ubiquinone/menaquinone biosynthesis C-methylase UbiE